MKYIYTLVFIVFTNSVFSQLTQFQEDFLSQTDPRAYYSFKSAESIWQEGVQLVDYMYQSLEGNRKLVSTSNPGKLISDFNAKMRNIQNLKSDLSQKGFEQSFNTGLRAGDKFASGDKLGGAMDFLGGLAASRERKKAKEEMERQQRLLQQNLVLKMNQILRNAQLEATAKQNEFYRLAAYSLSKKEEQYYLDYVANLKCYKSSMQKNYSPSSTTWINNNCPAPQSKPKVIENTFLEKHIQYASAAKRKLKLYKSTKNPSFISGAKSFMSAAIKEKKSARYYKELISFYSPETEAFEVLALSNALNRLFPKSFSEKDIENQEKAKKNLVLDLVDAIKDDSYGLITLYLTKGIDAYVKESVNKTPIRLAVEFDSPDALQLILNKKLEGRKQSDKNAVIQKTILMAAALNSTKTIIRFIELGIPTDYTIKGYSPAEIAFKTKSYKTFMALVENSDSPEQYGSQVNEIKDQIRREKEKEANDKLNKLTKDFKSIVDNFKSFEELETFFNQNEKLLENESILRELWDSNNKDLMKKSSYTEPKEMMNKVDQLFIGVPIKKLFSKEERKNLDVELIVGKEKLMMPSSDSITLVFSRPGRLLGAAVGSKIIINGQETIKIKNKKTDSIKVKSEKLIVFARVGKLKMKKTVIYPFTKRMELVVDPFGYFWSVAPEEQWVKHLKTNDKKTVEKLLERTK